MSSAAADSEHDEEVHPAYTVIIVIIFSLVSFTFLFPCNFLIPLDRRTVAAVGALCCYITSTFLFPSHRIDLLHAVDFDVLILLASIMVINHIVVHLKETKRLIDWFQKLLKKNPIRGFWMISFVAFIVSPFLTNDGVCLLFVEPILRVFEDLGQSDPQQQQPIQQQSSSEEDEDFPLSKMDALYFLLSLACSTNIGSALTYTGNPQNMIVASDAIGVMPSYKFLIYMLAPSTVAWLITIKWIEVCWLHSRTLLGFVPGPLSQVENTLEEAPLPPPSVLTVDSSSKSSAILNPLSLAECGCGASLGGSPGESVKSPPLSPRRQRARARERMVHRAVRFVSSPLPYAIMIIFFAMIVMIFIDIMPISGLICVIAILMVLTIVLGNYWKNEVVWQEESATALPRPSSLQNIASALPIPAPAPERLRSASRSSRHSRKNSSRSSYASLSLPIHEDHLPTGLEPQNANERIEKPSSTGVSSSTRQLDGKDDNEDLPYTREDRIDNLNDFFDDLFKAIDYSLLLIFLGTFIVIESMASTGIPRYIWKSMVGTKPFRTVGSVISISAFVLIASQLLGNVAVVQLAKPNVQSLDDSDRRFAWSVIAFISTIGGNLTITGSAANIIVAEKANRMDATIALDFFKHYREVRGR
eukprot:scaffold369_cov177-Ochromonas_danica.AAC.11